MSLRREIDDLRCQLVLQPNDAQLVQRLAELMEQANEDLPAAVAYFRAALLVANEGNRWKAVALGKRALRLCPALPTVSEALAGWCLALALRSEAVGHYRLALEECRAVADAVGVARVTKQLTELGADLDALPAATRSEIEQLRVLARAESPEFAHVIRLATLLRDAGDGAAAAAAYLQAAKLRLSSSRPAAIALAQEAVLKLNRRLVEANELIGEWSAAQGRVDEAVAHYRSALSQHQAARDADGVARVYAALAGLGAVAGGLA